MNISSLLLIIAIVKKKKKWSREEYMEVMIAFYTAAKNPTTTTTTKAAYNIWREKHTSNRLNIDANKLANVRCNATIKNNYLTYNSKVSEKKH